ncbi:hypothetical protein HLVA_17590 [Haliovirga abyssi]|uniref:Tail specific protease domain-containing protein n=1 Tax=Haliovirga abyssi TaxID=2996794 RepID=A0AAU9DCX6_9FUSO|nr:hypothetical protein HLVA_17590 [Haliovirga abyssi]
MKKMVFIFLAMFYFSNLTNAAISKEMFLKEVKDVVKKGEDIHVNFYARVKKEELNNYIEKKFKKFNDTISEREAVAFLASLMAKIKDGHTTVFLELGKFLKRDVKFLPFKFYIIGNKVYLIKDYNNKITKGSLILKINNNPVDRIIKNISEHISYDTIGWKKFKLNNEFFMYYYLLYNPTKQYEIVYRDKKDNLIKKKIINGIGVKEYKKIFIKEEKKYSFKQISSKVAIMRIKTFDYDQEYFSFLEKSFSELKKKRINNLIIDIRDNGGGNSDCGELLGRYITNKKIRVFSYIQVKVCKELKKDQNKYGIHKNSYN